MQNQDFINVDKSNSKLQMVIQEQQTEDEEI